VGHATVLLELGGRRLLTDPVLRSRVGHLLRRPPAPDPAALGALDAVLVSHAHHDHLDVASLRALDRRGPLVVPRGCAGLVADLDDVREVEVGDRIDVAGVSVEALPAEHDGRRHPLAARTPALGFLVDRVYFAGDTDLFAGMGALAGRVDVALLPVWGWGARLPAGHLDPERAARAVALVEPSVAVPIHWGTLAAVGTQRGEDPSAPPRAFAAAVQRLAPAVEVRVLAPGERAVMMPPG
jgi:L-ascorbate metabolism protein UlaG (beta-lactamase superfamily)